MNSKNINKFNIAVFYYLKDTASKNMAEEIIREKGREFYLGKNNNNIVKFYELDKEEIYYDNLDKEINADLFVFLSKHSSKQKVDSLSVHGPGNFGIAMLGGKDYSLVPWPSFWIKTLFNQILKTKENFEKSGKKLDIDVTMEATHHGPFLSKPSIFLEIGSCNEAYSNKIYARIMKEVFLESFNLECRNEPIAVFCIGGTHYCRSFEKIQYTKNYAIGHVCAKYNVENLRRKLIIEGINKSIGREKIVCLDHKSLNSENKQKVLNLLKELNLDFVKTSFFSEIINDETKKKN